MKKLFSTLIGILVIGTATVRAQYFPTGMTWEEMSVEPPTVGKYPDDENAGIYGTNIYEIGADTLVGDVVYKKVLRDHVFCGLCVRESGDKVWLLTNDYPTEILLYNFDWDNNQEITTEYLKRKDNRDVDEYEVRQETFSVSDCQTVVINGNTYQYFRDIFISSLIRGIGKVAELNRFPGLLSYREPHMIIPGLIYQKVLWIKRNGVEIFRSEDPMEWTEEDPAGISITKSDKLSNSTIFDLQGRRLTGKPAKGVYIEDGKKRVVK